MLKALIALNRFGRILDREVESGAHYEILFLLGAPRSNTTLVHRLLSLHNEMVVPELREILFPGMAGGVMRALMGKVPASVYRKFYNPDIHEASPLLAEADDIGIMARFGEGLFAWVYEGAMGEQQVPVIRKEHLVYLRSYYAKLIDSNPGKLPVSKYFAGVHQFDNLKEIFPKGKFVLLLRDPEPVVHSVSTLIGTALAVRKVRLANPELYWGRLYGFIVQYYRQIEWLLKNRSNELFIVNDREVKENLKGVMEQLCHFSGKGFEKHSSLSAKIDEYVTKSYVRKYTYLNVMNDFYHKEDFSGYYELQRSFG